jgi:hypothetical protein
MMRVSRIGMARLGAAVAILVLAVAVASAGASSVSLAGTWKGSLSASGKRVSFGRYW